MPFVFTPHTSSPPVALAPPSFWLPCLSVLCFAHCLGMAFLAPWLPAAIAALSEAPWLEWTLAALVAVSTVWVLHRTRPGSVAVGAAAFALALVAAGTALEAEVVQQAGFLSAAVVQVVLSRRLQRACRTQSCGGEICALPPAR
jgi:membrane protein implicated in regulation of membrane protease activity